MFLTILGTGFNPLYWLKFMRRSIRSLKIPPPPVLWTFEDWFVLIPGTPRAKTASKFPTQVPDFMINYPSSKEKMFKWREKGMVYGLSVISIILTYSTMWNAAVFSHWMQYLRMNYICFTFTALVHVLFNSCSCILYGQQLFCENSKISAATYWIDHSSCKT